MKQIVFFVLTLMLNSCSSVAQTQIEKERSIRQYWDHLLESMCEGNVKNVQKMITLSGLESIVRKAPFSEYESIFKEFCLIYKNEPTAIIFNNISEVQLSIGKEDIEQGLYSSGVVLKYIDKEWKLCKYYPSK